MNTSADLSRATKEGAIYILVCVGLISIETWFNMQRQDEFLSRGLWLQCVCVGNVAGIGGYLLRVPEETTLRVIPVKEVHYLTVHPWQNPSMRIRLVANGHA